MERAYGYLTTRPRPHHLPLNSQTPERRCWLSGTCQRHMSHSGRVTGEPVLVETVARGRPSFATRKPATVRM